jgi:hypothetical protein
MLRAQPARLARRALSRPRTRWSSTIVLITVGLALGVGGGCGSSSSTTGTPPPHVLSSVTDGATLVDAVQWSAHPVGLDSHQMVDRLDFLVDGRVLWSSYQAPYIFGLDDGAPAGKRLFPWILGAGEHRLAIRATVSGGRVVTSSVRVSVRVIAPVPRPLVGTFARTVTAADIARTRRMRHEPADQVLPPGTWRLHIGPDGLIRFDDPQGSGGNEAFTATASGGLTLHGPANWLNPPDRQGSFCGVEPDGSWRWIAHGRRLTLIARHDGCADRNSLFAGAWTRQ